MMPSSASPETTAAHPSSLGGAPERTDLQNPTGRPLPKVHKGSARMFETELLETFSRVHPATPAILYGPVVVISFALALTRGGYSWAGALGALLAGYLGWTVLEYWLHRLFFHLTVRGPKTKRVYFVVHGVHHDYPWDTSRLVIPPGASLILAAIFYGLFRLVFGPTGLYPFFAGFVGGYVIYDTTHWYLHARVPRTRFGRWLRREHMVHHFKAPTTRFGVSCPWMDHVFRTTGRPETP